MEEGSVGIVETKTFTFAEAPHEMELDCGRTLGPVTLAYETYGELNEDRTNAILLVHALSGDAHAAGYHTPTDRAPGWWDSMVGPGKGFDTKKYFVICSNVLGGCSGSTGPTTINPETGEPYGLTFPIITIGDMVRAQRQLVKHLGIERLLCVAGGSMGGMQTLEWMTRYPDMLESAMVIASTPVSSAQSIAFNAVGRHAIQADSKFAEGRYYGQEAPAQGLSIARMLGHITYLSDESMRAKFGRALRNRSEYGYDFDSEFSVETYLDYKGEQFVNRFDANSYLYISKAIDYFDIAADYGSLDLAMARVQAKTLVLTYSSDWLFPPYQSQHVVDSLARQGKDVSYCNIQSEYGHDAFLLEVDVMKKIVSGFLEHVHEPGKLAQPQQAVEQEPSIEPIQAATSIYKSHRVDYDMIVNLVEPGSRVLDIGCGNGELLRKLMAEKNVNATGIESSQNNVVNCLRSGISVIHANVDEGLSALSQDSFDYIILSMTLQVVEKPELVIREMLRVGTKCIVSFPNLAYWRARATLLLAGRAPVTRSLPYSWYTSPNRHVLSIRDFRNFCRAHNVRIEKQFTLSKHGEMRFWPNLLADEALFVISGENGR